MKRTISLLLIVAAVLVSTQSFAPKSKAFQGKITFKISVESDDIPEQVRAMLPTIMTLYVGSDKSKSELFTQMGAQSSIEDFNNKTKVGLLDIMGQKYALTESAEDVQKEIDEAPEIELEYPGDYKEIAGYKCKKVVARKKEDGALVSTAWVAEEMDVHENMNFSNPAFNRLKGMMLQFDTDTGNGMILTFTAIEVDQKKIKDKFFEIPEDYQPTTKEELQRSFGG